MRISPSLSPQRAISITALGVPVLLEVRPEEAHRPDGSPHDIRLPWLRFRFSLNHRVYPLAFATL
eukprot:617720-Heterocapsa_arctica.AAC.1